MRARTVQNYNTAKLRYKLIKKAHVRHYDSAASTGPGAWPLQLTHGIRRQGLLLRPRYAGHELDCAGQGRHRRRDSFEARVQQDGRARSGVGVDRPLSPTVS